MDEFQLPLALDYGATLLWAISGGLIAARRGYDVTGIFILALVSSTGGGLIRDGLFLQQGPPVLVTNPIYLAIVAVASVLVLLIGLRVQRLPFLHRLVSIVDAIGLGGYAVVGIQKARLAGLSPLGMILVGVVNAVGGSLLRDVLMWQEPELFKPGSLLASASLIGCIAFLIMTASLQVKVIPAAWLTIGLVFALRMLAVQLGWKTRPAIGFQAGKKDKR